MKSKYYMICVFVISAGKCSPIEEAGDIISDGEIKFDNGFLNYLIPSGYSPKKFGKITKTQLSTILDKDNEYVKILENLFEGGVARKGTIFNIFDENIREAAIALFRLLQDLDTEQFESVKNWAKDNINNDLFEYSWRLVSLFNHKFTHKEYIPPYIIKPNYYINAETLYKALKLKINHGYIHPDVAVSEQIFIKDDLITINTNYSNWDLPQNICDQETNYFREDISLNSYYYGQNLLHPFWMSNDELSEYNPRHDEHYYYLHKQLLARYHLEQEHLLHKILKHTKCTNYNPYLVYENGLSIPTRYSSKHLSEEKARLKEIDIAIDECISRGFIMMENGTFISMTEENYTNLLTKLIRANFDGVKVANAVRSLYGFGYEHLDYTKMHNPTPSLFHQHETSLRDPLYWDLIKYMLNYFKHYENKLNPHQIEEHQNMDLEIIDSNFTKVVTYFEYFQFPINEALGSNDYNQIQSHLVFTARQRRLNHLPFILNFTVVSKIETDVIVRLFLGPNCNFDECWQIYEDFFELDQFKHTLLKSDNIISWSSKNKRFSFDDRFNFEISPSKENRYNIFKFPKNLLIPKGLEDGLNLTLAIVITLPDKIDPTEISPESNYYKRYSHELDRKPLGFPFNRRFTQSTDVTNMKFYNITIYHKKNSNINLGIFSSHLY